MFWSFFWKKKINNNIKSIVKLNVFIGTQKLSLVTRTYWSLEILQYDLKHNVKIRFDAFSKQIIIMIIKYENGFNENKLFTWRYFDPLRSSLFLFGDMSISLWNVFIFDTIFTKIKVCNFICFWKSVKEKNVLTKYPTKPY